MAKKPNILEAALAKAKAAMKPKPEKETKRQRVAREKREQKKDVLDFQAAKDNREKLMASERKELADDAYELHEKFIKTTTRLNGPMVALKRALFDYLANQGR